MQAGVRRMVFTTGCLGGGCSPVPASCNASWTATGSYQMSQPTGEERRCSGRKQNKDPQFAAPELVLFKHCARGHALSSAKREFEQENQQQPGESDEPCVAAMGRCYPLNREVSDQEYPEGQENRAHLSTTYSAESRDDCGLPHRAVRHGEQEQPEPNDKGAQDHEPASETNRSLISGETCRHPAASRFQQPRCSWQRSEPHPCSAPRAFARARLSPSRRTGPS